MLRELRVANLALVDDLVIGFDEGLTMLTGETGAGKSLIAGALNLLVGSKGDKRLIREGENLAIVEGVFDLSDRPSDLSAFADAGLRIGNDGLLVMRRELKRDGRGRVLINGLISSLSIFERLGPRLLSIQSQDQQRILSQPSFARQFLDRALQLDAELSRMADAVASFKALRRLLGERTSEQEFADQQLELWEFQWRELDEAGLSVDEESSLKEQLAFGRNLRGLMDGATAGIRDLSQGEVNARLLLARTVSALEPMAGHSEKLESLLGLIRDAETLVTEAGNDLERFTDSVNVDPAQLDKLEQRHQLYSLLQRKFGRNVDDLLTLQNSLKDRIERQRSAVTDIGKLREDLATVRGEMAAAALDLRNKRLAGASQLALRAEELIRPLALPELGLEFCLAADRNHEGEIELDGHTCRVTEHGCDLVILRVRTNRGEAWNPVGDVASGGEKSRIFLGLSVLEAEGALSPLQLYDEIDAGLGMDNAVPVARLLVRLACCGQVICITHLPTVAAMGEGHLQVRKSVHDGRTTVTVEPLEGVRRVEELARLLGGEQGSGEDRKAQLAYAKQLLSEARGKGI